MKLSHPLVVLGALAACVGAVVVMTPGKPGVEPQTEVTTPPAPTAAPPAPVQAPPTPPPPRTFPSAATEDELAEVTRLVGDRLKDPESARFRDVRVLDSSGAPICGEVNAKNGFGGYIGFSAFVIMRPESGEPVVWIDSGDEAIAASVCKASPG